MMSNYTAGVVTASSGCQCGCGGSGACAGQAGAERTNFFFGQLVTADDLTQDQIYFRDKALRHNRLLHGWGVVCGARVMKHPTDACKVRVEAGYILGPYGHEIVIDRDVEVDVCHEDIEGNAVSACGADPWCADVRVSRPGGRPVYLAVRYDECLSRPVHVHAQGCSCGAAECQYSRVRDSFAIKILNDLPAGYSDPMPQPDIDGVVSCVRDAAGNIVARACAPCPAEPWVILADLVLEDDGRVRSIDCFAHRRHVVSFADYYFLCGPRLTRPNFNAAVLVDRTAAAAAQPDEPRIMVAVRRPEGSTAYVPLHFNVVAGETLASLLAREGQREFLDPATSQTFRLADLYALAGVPATTQLNTILDAAAPLQGLQLNINELGEVRNRLDAILDSSGLQRLESQHANVPAAVADLPATDLRGVGRQSPVGRVVANMTVSQVAALSRSEFIERIAAGVEESQRAAVRDQAGAVWDASAEALRLTGRLRRDQ